MSKRKRNIDFRKEYTARQAARFASGSSISEHFPSFIEQEEVYVDITSKVKPYTRSILLHVSQHGRVIGSIQMKRRP